MPLLRPSMLLAAVLVTGIVERADSRVGEPDAPSLRVVTFNLAYEDVGRKPSLDAIARLDADVVVLQEVSRSWEKLLTPRFATQYPYRVLLPDGRRQAGGIGVMSKQPIVSSELWPSPVDWFPAQRLVLATPIGPLQILNLHLRPAILDGSWVKGFMETPPLRMQEIEAYWPKVDPALPTLVAGDFNEDPGLTVDRFLTEQGVTRVVPGGPLKTWRWFGDVNGVPIELAMDLDHVFVSSHLRATRAEVVDAGSSDHRPVLVELTAASR